jgi:hypothetical protein
LTTARLDAASSNSTTQGLISAGEFDSAAPDSI